MGVLTHQYEFTSCLPPQRLFKALAIDGDNLIPKVAPNMIKSIQNLKGEGAKAGTVQRISFCDEKRHDNVKCYDVVDEDNLVFAYTMVEGDFTSLSDKIEKASYEYKLEATPSGGTLIKNSSKYYTTGDDVQIDKETFDIVKEKASGLFSLLETYLKNNPDEYN